MLKIATAVSSYPLYNYRYMKLLTEFSKYCALYVFASSKLNRSKNCSYKLFYRVYYVFPSILPRRIRYYFGGTFSQLFINLVKPDVLWLFDTCGPMFPLFSNSPVILDLDDPDFDFSNKMVQLKQAYLLRNHRVKKIVVPTKMIKEKFVKVYDIPEDKVVVIPSGVDLELFSPTSIPDDDYVLYYGILQPHRLRFLLRVVSEVLKLKSNVKFIIIGDAPRWLREYFRANRLVSNIVMPGYIEHNSLPEWVRKAKVCIFTQDISLGGRFSLKLIEYMACGRPIVATDVDESWSIKESGAGIISPLNPTIFAENIIKLLEDKSLAEKLAKKGVDYARHFSWSEIVKEYIRLIREVAT